MHYTIHFPCYPFVKKYFESNGQFPIPVKKSDKFGKVFYLALERTPKILEKYPILGATVDLSVTRDIYEKKGLYYSKESILLINDIVFDEIFDEIFNYLYNTNHNIGLKQYDAISVTYSIKKRKETTSTSKKIKKPDLIHFIEVKNVIEEILGKYNINFDDISFESLHRAYYRRKKRYNLLKAS